MNRLWIDPRTLAAGATLAWLAGCSPPTPAPPTPPDPPPPVTATGTSTTSAVPAAANDGVAAATPAGDPAASPAAETAAPPREAMPTESFGVPNATAGRAAPPKNARPTGRESSTATAPPADVAGMSADEAAKRGTEIFEREGDLDGCVPYYHAALQKEPKQREALAQLADVQRLRAVRKLEAKEEDAAQELLDEAAAVARTLKSGYADLSPRERETVQQVLYIEAGFLARQDDAAAALQSLTEAADAGFEGFELIAVDPDFAAVRRLPEYAGLAARPTARRLAEAEKAAAERIAAYEAAPLALPWPTLAGDAANPDAWSARPALVVFVSPNVRPSGLQLSELAEAKKLSGASDLAIVIVADLTEEPQRDQIKKLVEGVPADAVLVLDQATIDGLAASAPHVHSRPTTFVVDRAGQARLKLEGWQSALKLAGAVRAVAASRE